VPRTIATTFGRVEVARGRFRCQGCWHRWCPANQLFTQLKGGTISQPLQEAAMLAGCSWPYRVASRLLKRLSGAQRSRGRDASADQSGRQAASRATTRGGGVDLLLCCKACSSSREVRAADAGRLGWRLGGEPGTAGRNGRESSGRLFTKGGSAAAELLQHVFLESARPAPSPTTTVAAGGAALGGDVWSLAAAWPPGQSGSTDAWWRPLAPASGPSRRGQVDQAGTSTALPTGDQNCCPRRICGGKSVSPFEWRHTPSSSETRERDYQLHLHRS
jgi:hypothetical protein